MFTEVVVQETLETSAASSGQQCAGHGSLAANMTLSRSGRASKYKRELLKAWSTTTSLELMQSHVPAMI